MKKRVVKKKSIKKNNFQNNSLKKKITFLAILTIIVITFLLILSTLSVKELEQQDGDEELASIGLFERFLNIFKFSLQQAVFQEEKLCAYGYGYGTRGLFDLCTYGEKECQRCLKCTPDAHYGVGSSGVCTRDISQERKIFEKDGKNYVCDEGECSLHEGCECPDSANPCEDKTNRICGSKEDLNKQIQSVCSLPQNQGTYFATSNFQVDVTRDTTNPPGRLFAILFLTSISIVSSVFNAMIVEVSIIFDSKKSSL